MNETVKTKRAKEFLIKYTKLLFYKISKIICKTLIIFRNIINYLEYSLTVHSIILTLLVYKGNFNINI